MNVGFYLICNYYNLFLSFLFVILYKYGVGSSKINRRLFFIYNHPVLDNLPLKFRNKQLNRYRILKNYEEDKSEVCILPDKSNVYRNSKITITNNQNEMKINEELLLEASNLYISKLGLDEFMLDIFIEDENSMKNINKDELGKDKPTDIISLREDIFYTKSDYLLNKSPFKDPEHYHLGEIFLCPKYIKHISEMEECDKTKSIKDIIMNRKEGGVAVRMEGVMDVNTRMCFLLAHGILHLIGYDHVKDEEFVEMSKMEDTLLDEYIKNLFEKYNNI